MFAKLFAKVPPRTVTVAPSGTRFTVPPKQTVLGAALDQGIDFPHNCRVGGCGTCKCKKLSGTVKELTDTSYVLSAEELREGYILACQSVPQSDLSLHVPNLGQRPQHERVQTTATIAGLTRLTHDIMAVELMLEQAMSYTPGQYVEVALPGRVDEPRSYSMARAADGATDRIHLTIRRVPGGAFTEWLHGQAQIGDRLAIRGPFGSFYLRPATRPLVCIAGGSGLAPIEALLQGARREGIVRDVVLLFGARTQADLYRVTELETLARNWLAGFKLQLVLSAEPADSDWSGARGLVTDMLRTIEGLDGYDAYMCGPPPMCDAARTELLAAAVPGERIFADAFTDRSHAARAA